MQIRFQNSPKETSQMNTQELRSNFLVEKLVEADKLNLVYSHYERMIMGSVKPVSKMITLDNHPELRSDYFLERRELGIINVGGDGSVLADGTSFTLSKLSCAYLGKGTKEVQFQSHDKKNPAVFFLLSVPAHQAYP